MALSGYDFGAQAGNYFLLQGMIKYDRKQGITLKDTILREWHGMPQLLRGLDKICGLFISSCTKVMVRARLRDLIAFAGPLVLPEAFPLLLGKSGEDSIASWVHVLSGSEDLYDWAANQKNSFADALTSGGEEIKDLILGVLRILKPTGVTPTGEFSTAWISPLEGVGVITSRCPRDSWLALLADSEFSATFACVTPLCLITRDCSCLRGIGKSVHCSFETGLRDFTLSTRVSPYVDLPISKKSRGSNGMELEEGRSYLINTRDFETIAKIREVVESDEPYYVLEVKKTMLGAALLKRLYMRGGVRFIRESNDPNSSPCLIVGSD